jgi:transposase
MIPQELQAALFPDSTLHLDALDIHDQELHVTLTSTARMAFCPSCGIPSSRVHSHYTRRARDLPWATLSVALCLVVRRFRCTTRTCGQRIFAERLTGLIDARARLTKRLNEVLLWMAITVGAEPGQRLLTKLGIHIGADKLLALSHAAPLPTLTVPNVVGVDDFALKRGRTYGTVIVDLEAGQPLALLPSRSAEVVAPWLKAYPNVAVVSRDRSSEYERAVNLGAPGAQHVLDRWHVLKNLREVLERVCRRQHALIQEVGQAGWSEVLIRRRTAREASARQTALERRHQRINEVRTLHEQGRNIAQIAQELRCSRTFVRVCIRLDQLPAARQKRRPPNPLAADLPYLTERWNAGCHNAKQLERELRTQGFTGTYRQIYEWTVAMRNLAVQQPGVPIAPPPLEQVAWERRGLSPRQLSWLLVLDERRLNVEERVLLNTLKQRSNEVMKAHQLAQTFRRLFTDHDTDALPGWLEQAQHSMLPEFKTFAIGLQRERSALTASMALRWSNGPTEGVVNRIKLVKRQMYGRGSLDLLRKRVLLAA